MAGLHQQHVKPADICRIQHGVPKGLHRSAHLQEVLIYEVEREVRTIVEYSDIKVLIVGVVKVQEARKSTRGCSLRP